MSTISDLIPDVLDDGGPSSRVLALEDPETDHVIEALSSETRRELYRHVFEEPMTASELADAADTSVQNVSHHVDVLEESELVREVGHRYSEKGSRMSVYGPASDPVVLVGREEVVPTMRRRLPDLLVGVGLIAAASLLVQYGVYRFTEAGRTGGSALTTASPAAEAESTGDWLTWLLFDVGEPGLIFFLGSLVIAGTAALALRGR